jgi:hypothetical protein
MLNSSVRRAGLLAFLVVISVSCSDATLPTGPPPTATGAVAPSPPAPGPGPTDSSGARVFGFVSSPYPAVQGYTAGSRYVLYRDGAFVLQYPHVEYRGRYTETEGRINFEWDGWSVAGPWGATGVLSGDSLSVSYNIIMVMSDFEDALYKRVLS